MSKKRTSDESNSDEQTQAHLQNDGHRAQRPRILFNSDTTLQDLPNELLEHILVNAVATEVMDMLLAKCAWAETAGRVINRLGSVSPQWTGVLSTNSFRTRLHRTLDGTAQKTINVDLLQLSPRGPLTQKLAAMNDEVYVLWWVGIIEVYDRNNLEIVKQEIPLGIVGLDCIATCSLTNSIYVLKSSKINYVSILRIKRDDEQNFYTAPMITDVWVPNPKHSLSVAANGNLILLAKHHDKRPLIVMMRPDGDIQNELKLPSSIPKHADIKVTAKSNGSLVVIYSQDCTSQLIEMNTTGQVIRTFSSSTDMRMSGAVIDASTHGHLLIWNRMDNMELLDPDFHLLNTQLPRMNLEFHCIRQLTFNKERKEIVAFLTDNNHREGVLAIFGFTEQ